MISMDSRRSFVRLIVLLCALAVTGGCSLQARAHRSLKNVVHKEVEQFNKYHQRQVKPNVYESGGQFYRIYHERTDPTVTMRRTNSIDTPYIATLVFTENIYLTRRHPTGKESKQDVHFILNSSNKREIVYTFVNGMWKRKETY
ncbi:hypothetical protein HZA56_12750 [Candidatus Poribacteria bacterium]|nr:hypothetical protein [Candidatus Poribacteria bacterium]